MVLNKLFLWFRFLCSLFFRCSLTLIDCGSSLVAVVSPYCCRQLVPMLLVCQTLRIVSWNLSWLFICVTELQLGTPIEI